MSIEKDRKEEDEGSESRMVEVFRDGAYIVLGFVTRIKE